MWCICYSCGIWAKVCVPLCFNWLDGLWFLPDLSSSWHAQHENSLRLPWHAMDATEEPVLSVKVTLILKHYWHQNYLGLWGGPYDLLFSTVMFTVRYASLEKRVTEQIVSSTDKQPLLETPGEVSCELFVIIFLKISERLELTWKSLSFHILIVSVNSRKKKKKPKYCLQFHYCLHRSYSLISIDEKQVSCIYF